MGVKRYDYGGGMMEFDTGPYVRFDDYAAVRAECDRLRFRVAVLEARPENAIVAGLEYKAAQLRAERDAMRRVLTIVEDYCDSDMKAYAHGTVAEHLEREMRRGK